MHARITCRQAGGRAYVCVHVCVGVRARVHVHIHEALEGHGSSFQTLGAARQRRKLTAIPLCPPCSCTPGRKEKLKASFFTKSKTYGITTRTFGLSEDTMAACNLAEVFPPVDPAAPGEVSACARVQWGYGAAH